MKIPKNIEEFLRCRISMCDIFEISSCDLGSICLKDSIKESLDDIAIYYERNGYNISYRLYDFLISPLKNSNLSHSKSGCRQISLILSPMALVANYYLNGNKGKIMECSDFIYIDTKQGKLYTGVSTSNPRFFR